MIRRKAMPAGRQGFTLIELIVVFALFAVVVVIVTNFLITMIKNNNQTSIQNEVRQNAAKIMEDISTEIRNSGCVITGVNSLTLYPELNCNSSDLGIVKYLVDESGVLTKNVNGNNVGTLTSNRVAVCGSSSCGAACGVGLTVSYPDDTLPDKANHAVAVSLTLQQVNTGAVRSDFCAKVTLKSTVNPRNAGN